MKFSCCNVTAERGDQVCLKYLDRLMKKCLAFVLVAVLPQRFDGVCWEARIHYPAGSVPLG